MYTVDTYVTIQTALSDKMRQLLNLWIASNGDQDDMNFWAERIMHINDAKAWNMQKSFE